MKDARRNDSHPTGMDNLFNGGIIALGIVGLLLAVLVGPMTNASNPARPPAVAGMVMSESAV
jgi:hypothetical protein